MTLILQQELPASSILIKEGIRASLPGETIGNGLPTLNIALLNLMPNITETEVQ